MNRRFPYPMPLHALDEFRHPADWHGLHHARRHEDEVLAGNGYVAIRVRKGMWLESDHESASAEFLGRWGKLPWSRFDKLQDEWRGFDSVTLKLFAKGQIGFWLRDTPAPTPIWRVNETLLVRLSLLQLVSRLPRCECFTGPQSVGENLYFRFSGGIGIIPPDRRLTLASGEIFPAARDMWSGERYQRRPQFQGVESHLKDWPPVDTSDV